MRNMKNSTLEEPLIHLSIWVRNDAIMNVEDDEADVGEIVIDANMDLMSLMSPFC